MLSKLQKDYAVNFVYSPQLINAKQLVSVSCTDLPLAKFLDQTLSPLGLGYEVKDDVITIIRKADNPQGSEAVKVEETVVYQNPITGIVKGTDGAPLVGATVNVKDGTATTKTDENGKFVINAKAGQTLIISFIGFNTKEVAVTGTEVLNISMGISDSQLENVVVIGYGSMKKKDLTGSVTQIRPDNIANENPKTVQDILRGAPGLRIGYDASAKGGGNIQVRGQRSVYTDGGHNNPLIILDGIFFYGELSEINPDDIAQIDVLKDASAAAIYGSKAASGVIIINTKTGKKGKPVINTTLNIGATDVSTYRKRFDTEAYMQHRQDWFTTATYGLNAATNAYEAYQTDAYRAKPGYFMRPDQLPDNITLDAWRAYSSNQSGESDQSIWARRLGFQGNALQNFLDGKVTDWADKTFRTGINQDFNTSISGASDRLNYYFSMGYLKNEGAVVSDNYRAIRSNLKLNAKVTDWFEVGANVNFQDRSDGNVDIDMDQMLRNSPYADYADASGNPVQFPLSDVFSQRGYNYDFQKKYLELEKGYTVLNAIVNAKIKLPFNITYSFNASPRYQFFYDRYFMSADLPGSDPTTRGANREQSKSFNWTLNNTINWDQTFAQKHRVNITLVQEAEELQSWTDLIQARKILPSDALGFHNTKNGTKENSSYSSSDSRQTADGLLARLFYSYDSRYMLTTSIRRDGYSAFGTSNPYATFPSLALAWNFTNEKFFKWNDIMSNGKLRVSYGKNGNRSLANPYLALANLYEGAGKMMGYINSSGQLSLYRYLMADRLANPNLQWEKTASWNFGLDFGFLNERIYGSFEYYSMQTQDMIMNQRLPSFTGFDNITTNLGQVDNTGFDFALNTVNIRNKTLQWTTTLGISYNKNRIKHLYYEYADVVDADGKVTGRKEMDDITNGWFIGKSIGAIWDYRVTGIWQLNEYDEAKRHGQKPGDVKVDNSYTDDDVINADGSRTPVYNNNDKQFLGETTPPWHWSLRNEVVLWNDLSISFNIYSYMGHKSLSGNYLNNDDDGGRLTYALANLPQKEYWTIDNPTNKYGRIQAAGPTGATGAQMLYNRSFIRLDNISVGYSLPSYLTSKMHLNKVKVFGTVRNVRAWSKDWEFGDPETGAWATRVFNLGLNVTF
ncbi:MAG: SusC/RagA family TonB-linked outer membrane protein [Candidatus Pseudobacter hemicellulosilyticus]|uniref:SusC/RagA family TonB-linked outer membrane protein n=1 Tax=Candidatus Pseudobacter hemicellulosilyticus TaxID=3121375 RepID=A0AAJ5WTX4_9BACT|nr:MAG: SusC/RagA family TonB-linked outer membrane protein [Pseudobacter sp.]